MEDVLAHLDTDSKHKSCGELQSQLQLSLQGEIRAYGHLLVWVSLSSDSLGETLHDTLANYGVRLRE
jgi:hypothetical protein